MTVDVKYTARATATGGGRDGHTRTDDGRIDLRLAMPKEMGGPGGGTNPEQLFAAGYAACFLGAMRFVAGQEKVRVPEGASVSSHIGIGPRDAGGFGITAQLDIALPGMNREEAQALVEKAHQVCPYSNATRGNLDVRLNLA
jgi:Ohr subfamily peroxiredoxin